MSLRYKLDDLDAYESKDHEALFKLNSQVAFWLHRTSIILDIINASTEHGHDADQFSVISGLVLSASISCISVQRLSSTLNLTIKDSLVIARMIFETCLNAAYIATDEGALAKRANYHAFQKYIRGMERESTIGDTKISIKASKMPEVMDEVIKDAVSQFTDKKGREIRSWTNESVDERISKVGKFDQNAGFTFSIARAQIYRESSEMMHGTYYGHLFFKVGFYGKQDGKIKSSLEHQSIMVFSTIIFSAEALLIVLGKKFGINKIPEAITKLVNQLRNLECMRHVFPPDSL